MSGDRHQTHATCVAIQSRGILIFGPPGAGKSSLALRLMEYPDTQLVADDRVDLSLADNALWAQAPANIQGLIEVRFVGIRRVPFLPTVKVELCVHLAPPDTTPPRVLSRLPDADTHKILDRAVPRLTLPAEDPYLATRLRAALLTDTATDLS